MDRVMGYAGKLLRVELSSGQLSAEPISTDVLRKYVGGTCLGAWYLYNEVPPGVEWSDPENRMIWASGPLGATPISGTGTFSVVSKGAMTNLSSATQANGFFGAYLRKAGFDALLLQGRAPRWSYLLVREGGAELRDARELVGLDTCEVEEALSQQLGLKLGSQLSVFGIGPAGENGVRFAALVGDQGHVAAHNGVGAVLGSKRVKAVAVARSKGNIPFHDSARLKELAKELFEVSAAFAGGALYEYGTGGLLDLVYKAGALPVRNYTTNLLDYERLTGQYLRTHFEHRPKPCWACRVRHTHWMKVTQGPYAGVTGEEPEYEGLAGMGSNIGVTDPGAVMMLCNLLDRLGMDFNESSWLVSWLMECCEKGIVTAQELGGIELKWGDADAVASLLRMVAAREGPGKVLAEGVMRASRSFGRGSAELGIYTLKGNTPRSHDHRGRWFELLDTCLSNTGTIEASFVSPPQFPGRQTTLQNPFHGPEVARVNAFCGGWRQFEDSLGICRWCSLEPSLTLEAVNAATGWDLGPEDALTIGRRGINVLRLFCFRHGLDIATEWPSARYCSTPIDGPAEGKSILPQFADMRRIYYHSMGWDEETGRPLPATLRELGLEDLV